MRTILTLSSILAVAACRGTGDVPTPRPERPSLLAQTGSLRGTPIVATSDGPWEIRSLQRPEPAARKAPAPGEPAPETGAESAFDSTAWNSVIGLGGGAGGKYGGRAGGREAKAEAKGATDAGEVVEALEEIEEGAVLHDSEATGARGDDGLRRGRASGGKAVSVLAIERAPAAAAEPAPALRAGSTDDNLDLDAFVKFLAGRKDTLKGRCEFLDVADRRSVRIVDQHGAPLPGAAVAIVDEDRDAIVWRGTTYGDGRFPFYPALLPEGSAGTVLLEIRFGDRFLRHHWNLKGDECVVAMPRVEADLDLVDLDVVFLIDTTGSMGDEIERIKASLLGVTRKLRNLDREFDLRYGAVLYRDINDAYVTKAHPFTQDLEKFDAALQTIQAQGGGDTPESLNQGLAVAIDGMEWRDGAAKVVFLIADAPPHMDYENDVSYGTSLEAAIARGIRIHSVAASGLDEAGTVVFRQVAQFTRGKFIFIEYGGDVKKTAESHGVTGPVKSNNLDDILFEQIRDEVAAWGRS